MLVVRPQHGGRAITGVAACRLGGCPNEPVLRHRKR